VTSSLDSLLMGLWYTSFISQDKPGSNPDGAGAQYKNRSERLAVVNTTRSNNPHRLANYRAKYRKHINIRRENYRNPSLVYLDLFKYKTAKT
jgi:hypothetical protein